jgi:hypothetical protein
MELEELDLRGQSKSKPVLPEIFLSGSALRLRSSCALLVRTIEFPAIPTFLISTRACRLTDNVLECVPDSSPELMTISPLDFSSPLALARAGLPALSYLEFQGPE